MELNKNAEIVKGSKDIFTDTMCGTGTLLIEGILITAKVAPTYLKIRQYIEKKVPVFEM